MSDVFHCHAFFLSTPTFKGSILHFKGLLFTKMAASPPGGVGLRVLRTPLTGPGSCALHGGGRVHPEMNGSPAVLKKNTAGSTTGSTKKSKKNGTNFGQRWFN